MSFFERFWYDIKDEIKLREDILFLIKHEQLIIVDPGIVENDESSSHYSDIIDQKTFGHRFALKTFNFTAKSAWQLDIFGHGITNLLLNGKTGYDS